MNLCVIGAGYVGVTTAICFAEMGNTVRIIDVDSEKAHKIKNGVLPIYEEGLQDLLTKNLDNIEATAEYEFDEDILFICVGTPSMQDGKIDLQYLIDASESVANNLKRDSIVVIKSTVFPGTTENIVKPIIKNQNPTSSVAMNPEFLREGKALYDFINPDRIIIGLEDKRTESVLKKLYKPIDAPMLITSLTEAEMIKYASNALLATKISFSNEIGNLCKTLGIDTYNVMKGVGMDHRISHHFLNAGIGFGGSCFPKDLRGLYAGGQELDHDMNLINATLKINQEQPLIMITLLNNHLDIKGKTIAILGLAFKADTDDVRESRSIPVIKELKAQGAIIKAYDPKAMSNMKQIVPDITYCNTIDKTLNNSDACLILTDWKEFEYIDFSTMKNKLVIEGRRILKNKEGILYEGICW